MHSTAGGADAPKAGTGERDTFTPYGLVHRLGARLLTYLLGVEVVGKAASQIITQGSRPGFG